MQTKMGHINQVKHVNFEREHMAGWEERSTENSANVYDLRIGTNSKCTICFREL